MSVAAGVLTDAKAGYCTSCRQGAHGLCASARCACTATGHSLRPTPRPPGLPASSRNDQQPPVVSAPAEPGGGAVPAGFACPDCPATFDGRQQLGSHRAACHGYRAAKKPGRPSGMPRGQVARRAAEIADRAAAEAEPFDVSAGLRLDHLLGARDWVDVGIVELRAFPTDDGRLRVRARWVHEA